MLFLIFSTSLSKIVLHLFLYFTYIAVKYNFKTAHAAFLSVVPRSAASFTEIKKPVSFPY